MKSKPRNVLPPWQGRCAVVAEEGLQTCERLAPVEAALRAAGIRLRHTPGGAANVVLCECRFHEQSLLRLFVLPAVVRFSAYGDHFGDGQQSLDCRQCRSSLCVFDPVLETPRSPTTSHAGPPPFGPRNSLSRIFTGFRV